MINLAPVAAADMAAAEDLYLAAFPPEERRPWQQIADTGTMPRLCGLYNCVDYIIMKDCLSAL